jgi:hypothetical protein
VADRKIMGTKPDCSSMVFPENCEAIAMMLGRRGSVEHMNKARANKPASADFVEILQDSTSEP